MTKSEYINYWKTAPFFGKKYDEFLEYSNIKTNDKKQIIDKKVDDMHLSIIKWSRGVSIFVIFFYMNVVKFEFIENFFLRFLIQLPIILILLHGVIFIMHYSLCWIFLENTNYKDVK